MMGYAQAHQTPTQIHNQHSSSSSRLRQCFFPILSKSAITRKTPSMEAFPRISHRLLTLSSPKPNSKFLLTPFLHLHNSQPPISKFVHICPNPLKNPHFLLPTRTHTSSSSPKLTTRAGWLLALGEKKQNLPDLVKAGDPVLHEPAREVNPNEIGSDRIQKIVDDMIKVMRMAPGVGLAAPQIGIPFKIIVLEDTKEYISYAPKEDIKAQGRRPFDLLI